MSAPILTILAGPNGSGKSTLTRKLLADGADFGAYINPDDIAARLQGSYVDRVAAAQKEADRLRDNYLRQRVSFSFETVMSHPSKVEFLETAGKAGFEIVLFFVATEQAEINVGRVAQRVSLGGHDVPADRIIERYDRTLGLLPRALACCTRAVLFDNSHERAPMDVIVFRPFFELTRNAAGDVTLRRLPPIPNWAVSAIEGLKLT